MNSRVLPPEPATEAECIAELELLAQDKTVLLVGFTRGQMWALACAVQLALRHPHLTGASAKIMATIGGELVALAVPEGPLRELWLRGQVPDDHCSQVG